MKQSKWLLSGLAVAALLAWCQAGRAEDAKQAPNPISVTQASQAPTKVHEVLVPWSVSLEPGPAPCLPVCNEPYNCSTEGRSAPKDNNPNNLQDFIKVLECLERLAKLEKATDDESPENNQVQELIKILNETKSPAVLVATAVALMPLGDKARPAVPAILRNAERLKVLDDGATHGRKAELADTLMDVILNIQAGWTPDNDRTGRWGGPNRYPAPPAVAPAPYYYPATPPYGPGTGYGPQAIPPVCPAPSCVPACPLPPPAGSACPVANPMPR